MSAHTFSMNGADGWVTAQLHHHAGRPVVTFTADGERDRGEVTVDAMDLGALHAWLVAALADELETALAHGHRLEGAL